MKYPGFLILVLVMLAVMVLPIANSAGAQAQTTNISQWQTSTMDSVDTGIVESNKECTITTQDGRISINFPSGSVNNDTEITIKEIATTAVPPPPSTYKNGATCFAVTGVSSLNKEATVTVRYAENDVNAADGNTDLLRLSRYNEDTGEWDFLSATIDKEAQTFTTKTNKLSQWMVMVASPATQMWVYAVAVIASFIVLVTVSIVILRLFQRTARTG